MKYHTFLPQFHPLILAGSKTTTIRGSTRVKPGERFALRNWTARPYGSPMGFLGTAQCTSVREAHVSFEGVQFGWGIWPDRDAVARADGFADWIAMRDHFGKRLPFSGVLIAWDPQTFVAGAP